MPREHGQRRLLDDQDLIRWREATMTAAPEKGEPGAGRDALDHTGHISFTRQALQKSAIQISTERKQSLLTKALQPTQEEFDSPELYTATDMARRRSTRSTISNTSTMSTTDLTSDGLTSPTRTSTPSPPFPTTSYMSFARYTFDPKFPPSLLRSQQSSQKPTTAQQSDATAMPKPDPSVEALVKKRCITFACAGQKPQDFKRPAPATNTNVNGAASTAAPKRTIKFACPGPKPERHKPAELAMPRPTAIPASLPKSIERHHARSPSIRKLHLPTTPQSKNHRDSTSTVRRVSRSPAAVRSRKPKYILADEEALELSEATRFHEFASDEPQEDDWIRKDTSDTKQKLTIHDTLKKENAIRQLGKEAEEEEDEDEDGNDTDDENDDDDDDDDDEEDDDDEDIEDQDSDDDNTVDMGVSDGNETDNEAGFADSDDESDTGEYEFWAPGKSLFATSGDANTFKSSARRTPSESSIDSLSHMSPLLKAKGIRSGRMKPSRNIRIRPGTPDLPDSTDFVCGTLDEDRPLEEAYVSCMEARKRERRRVIPQDIDPSFPTSDPEEEEDENDEVEGGNDSDDGLWFHGKFEDSDSETRRRRRLRKSPNHSPKRLHSPPPKRRSPPATRHRSPPPRRLFGQSPKRARSPPPARLVKSPPTSPAKLPKTIAFAPRGNRPGLTHTKSLPRRPNAISQQYRLSQLALANDDDDTENTDGHTRGAIDIVKGLEQKRQRRKDKFFSKLVNRARKGQQVERRPQPGKGAERMRELGLQMAGKTVVDSKNRKAEYVLSV